MTAAVSRNGGFAAGTLRLENVSHSYGALPAVSATLNVLRITGTLLAPCATCGLMSDVIETAADTKLAVRFNDGTALNLGGNARFAVDQFAFDPAARKGEFVGRALQGGFFFVGGRTEAQPNPKVEIRSPHAMFMTLPAHLEGAVHESRFASTTF